MTDPNGGVTQYTYDSAHRMISLKDARGIPFLTNIYDTGGRVYQQIQADNTSFFFSYVTNSSNKVTTAYVYDPRVALRKVDFGSAGYNNAGYTIADTRGLYLPQQQTTLFERQANTNFITKITDQLGRKTKYTYDTNGNVTTITRAAETAEAVTTPSRIIQPLRTRFRL